MSSTCSICGVFQKDGWEIENTQEDRFSDKFPENFHSLDTVFIKDESSGDAVLQCPVCHTYFLYRHSTPGGSYDAMKTYFVERIIPITDKEAEKIINPHEEKKYRNEYCLRCPKCRSSNAEKTDSSSIGGEIFITYKCNECGNEETVDEYQIDSWFS